MPDEQPGPLSEDQRKEIFKALVDAQDAGASPAASRTAIARQFSVTESQVRDIEREGSDAQWPPLA